MIAEWIAIILLLTGAFFMLAASIGIVRLPDLYMRMHATTKASTLGMLLMLSGLSVYDARISIILKSILIMFFIFMTAPIASHMIGRVAHMMKIPKWNKTGQDDLENQDTLNGNAD